MTIISDTINVLFLGTGAADWPQDALKLGGEENRGFSSVLVDGQILIDCGPTVPAAMKQFGVDSRQVTDILVTHTHRDHFNIETIKSLISDQPKGKTIKLWAHASVLALLPDISGLLPCPARIGKANHLGPVLVTGLAANHHVKKEIALHFLLQKKDRSILYATDGAWLLKKTWKALQKTNLNAIIWDATCGETQGDWRIFEHNSIDMIRLMRQTLTTQGVLQEEARVFLTHMARTLCAPHGKLAERLIPEGLVPAHDGLQIII